MINVIDIAPELALEEDPQAACEILLNILNCQENYRGDNAES